MPCRIVGCVADCAPESEYCVVHKTYTLAGPESRCAKCEKKIRTGTYAIKRPDGKVEHSGACPL
jgi:hypothetical protein